ncbi:MAG: twin transmembrane helix small protein [Gammaproteobacteria bacterium]|nr:twin transmembrane helix small protein [Gammaproteobacteria bacterium]
MELLNLLIILALIAVILSLGWGIRSMGKGGSYDAEHSNQLMSARVGFQAVAVVLLLIVVFIQNF